MSADIFLIVDKTHEETNHVFESSKTLDNTFLIFKTYVTTNFVFFFFYFFKIFFSSLGTNMQY